MLAVSHPAWPLLGRASTAGPWPVECDQLTPPGGALTNARVPSYPHQKGGVGGMHAISNVEGKNVVRQQCIYGERF